MFRMDGYLLFVPFLSVGLVNLDIKLDDTGHDWLKLLEVLYRHVSPSHLYFRLTAVASELAFVFIIVDCSSQ